MNFFELMATEHQLKEVRISEQESSNTVEIEELIAMMSQKDGKVSKDFQHQGLSSDHKVQMYCNNQECNKFQVHQLTTWIF